MKYYINLIKRKKYKIILTLLFFIMFGIIGCVMIQDKPLEGTIIAIFGFMIGGVLLPRIYAEAQDDSDFEIKLIEDKIYIKFRDREFITHKDTFKTASRQSRYYGKLGKDQNGKRASWVLEAQICEYISYKYKHLRNVQVDENKVLNNEEIIDKFNGIRLATEEEKEKYVKYLKKDGRVSTRMLDILAKFWIFIGIACCCGAITSSESFFVRLLLALISFAIVVLGWEIHKRCKAHILLPRKVTNGKLYIADCYSYDKRRTRRHHYRYYIKVTDNVNAYLDKWFDIDAVSFAHRDEIKAKLFVVKYIDEYILNVYTERVISKWN